MRHLLPLLLFCLCAPVFAQQEMEIIPLRHRTVDQVLPAIKPFVEPGGTLSGMNNQLILRASRANREQIKAALAAIDTPQRRLLIRVSQERAAESRQQGVEVGGRVALGEHARIVQPDGRLPGGTRIEVRRGETRVAAGAYEARGASDLRASQMVQVIEGGRAFIQVGQSLPLALRQIVVGPNGAALAESVVYRDIGQGFYAVPQIVGDRVTLEISPQFDTPGGSYGSVNTQRLTTTVSGRLGEWIELGGSAQSAASREQGNFGAGGGERRDTRSVWLLVEELP